MKIEPGLIALVIMVVVITSTALTSFVAHRHAGELERHFSRSDWLIRYFQPFNYLGLYGKVLKCGFVSMSLLVPGLFVRRGFVDHRDLMELPRWLKIRLLVSYITLIGSTAVMFGYGWFLKR